MTIGRVIGIVLAMLALLGAMGIAGWIEGGMQ